MNWGTEQMQETLELLGVKINPKNYSDLLQRIAFHIAEKKKLNIAYANSAVLNHAYKNHGLIKLLSEFDIIHPDGIGAYRALRKVYPEESGISRFTGSDFYAQLWKLAIANNWKLFFFGHDQKTLDKIKLNIPELQISGTIEGYNFDTSSVIDTINCSNSDILIVGMGFPAQEKWYSENSMSLNPLITIMVGDGIKVFAGLKRRGPKWIRDAGLEWTVRLTTNPFKYGRRYLIGNPLFLYRIYRYKMAKLKKN